jgi:hypothetical protein
MRDGKWGIGNGKGVKGTYGFHIAFLEADV